MSERIELAKIELDLSEDLETVTASEVLRWLRARPGTDSAVAWVERAASAAGRAKRLRRAK